MKGSVESDGAKSANPSGGNSWSDAKKKKPPKTKQPLPAPRSLAEITAGRPKVLIVLRGLPGSGKSTLVTSLDAGWVCSADDFFLDEAGKYSWDPKKIQQAHEWCQKRALQMLEQGLSPVVVDNTNTMCWEARPYVKAAVERGYEIEILQPQTPWAFDPVELARKNRHAVPEAAIRKMLQRWEEDFTVERILGKGEPNHKPPRHQEPPAPLPQPVLVAAVADNGRKEDDPLGLVQAGVANLRV